MAIAICSDCRAEKRIHAKGMCTLCYRRTWSHEHPEQARAHSRQNHHRHRDAALVRAKKHYQEHRAARIAKQRENDAKRIEERRAYNREYRKKNAERLLAYHRAYATAYNKKYPEKIAAYQKARRARKKGFTDKAILYRALWEIFGHCCGVCHEPLILEEMTIDHILPLAKGGLHIYENVRPAHLSCNQQRSLIEESRTACVSRIKSA